MFSSSGGVRRPLWKRAPLHAPKFGGGYSSRGASLQDERLEVAGRKGAQRVDSEAAAVEYMGT